MKWSLHQISAWRLQYEYISLLEMDNPPINEETFAQFVFDVGALIT